MYRVFRTLVMVGGLVGVLGAGSASAQVTSPMTFKTWFPFTINHKTLPAGSYELRPLDQSPSVLELTSIHGHVGVFFETENIETRAAVPAPRSEIVFLRYGDQYMLKDVWVEGEATGAETPGKMDERHVAANTGTPTEVRVAAMFLRHVSRAQS